jgi:hypothetical protein
MNSLNALLPLPFSRNHLLLHHTLISSTSSWNMYDTIPYLIWVLNKTLVCSQGRNINRKYCRYLIANKIIIITQRYVYVCRHWHVDNVFIFLRKRKEFSLIQFLFVLYRKMTIFLHILISGWESTEKLILIFFCIHTYDVSQSWMKNDLLLLIFIVQPGNAGLMNL